MTLLIAVKIKTTGAAKNHKVLILPVKYKYLIKEVM